ncbi:hypothetical protein [Brevibacillus sp. SYSU BS000544]|uniref:hypothetical protein n=1 Tax=Brevibacillus sp. SYSU BS000544 TaxID=3416443 RepID=UPI003CE50060
MKLKRFVRQATKTILALIVTGGGILGYLAPSQFASASIAASDHGITLAKINKAKVLVKPFTELNISALDGVKLGAIMADIKVDGANAGNALGFVDSNAQADRGWYYVDETEARQWVTQLNGNPDYVLNSSRSNVYRAEVKDDKGFISSYQAYNLAELAVASGGHGKIDGDNLVQKSSDPDDYWKSVGQFYTTPRPIASVKTENPTYKVNQTVNILASATDHSYYDQGILIENLAVFNVTTNSGYQSLITGREIRPSPQAGVNYTWNGSGATDQQMKFVPTTPGTYKVYLYIRDLHGRAAQNSSDVKSTVAYEYTFTVDPAPVQANLLVDESSITFYPANVTNWSELRKVEFDVVNQSQTTYNPLLAFKFATSSDPSASAVTATLTSTPALSSGKATNLAGGERRRYSVSVSGLSSSATTLYFAANINYDKSTPPDETDWTDNRGAKPISLGSISESCDIEHPTPGLQMLVSAMADSGDIERLMGSGSYTFKKDTWYLHVSHPAGKKGTWRLNGTIIGSNVNYVEIENNIPKTFTLTFENGSNCWVLNGSKEGETEYKCYIEYSRGISEIYDDVPKLIKVAIGEQLNFKAFYTFIDPDDGKRKTKPAEVIWKAIKPDLSEIILTMTENDNDRGGLIPYRTNELTLPNPSAPPESQLLLNKGGEKYTVFVDEEVNGDAVRCKMDVVIEVNESCSIDQQKSLKVMVTGEPPSEITDIELNYYDSGGNLDYQNDIFFNSFTELPDGRYDTHMNVAATYPGKWYYGDPKNNKLIAEQRSANLPIDVILPASLEPDEYVKLYFVSSSPANCTFSVGFTARSQDSCEIPEYVTINGTKTVQRGTAINLSPEDFITLPYNFKGIEFHPGMKAQANLYLKQNGEWIRRLPNGDWLWGTNHDYNSHDVRFPKDEEGNYISGEYKLSWYSGEDIAEECEGYIIIYLDAGNTPTSCDITTSPMQATLNAGTTTTTVRSNGTFTMPSGITSLKVTFSEQGELLVNGSSKGRNTTFTITISSTATLEFKPNTPTNTNCWKITVKPASGGGGPDPQGCDIATSPAIVSAVVGTNTVSLPSGGTYTMPSGVTQIKLTFAETGTLKLNGASKGSGKTFTVMISSTSTLEFTASTPTATNCWGQTIVLGATQDCSIVFMHIYDSKKGDVTLNVPSGSTHSINAAKLDNFGVVLSDSATDFHFLVKATYTGPKPNESQVPDEGYSVSNLNQGTYTVKAVVNDTALPQAVGCQFTVTLKIGTTTIPEEPEIPSGGGGGNHDAGKSIIRLFDSDNRELALNADGVWEREPVRVRVELPYQKIDQLYVTITNEINQKITERVDQIEGLYGEFENVKVTPTPESIASAKAFATYQPASITLKVSGPGLPQNFTVSSSAQHAEHIYTGTTVPTETTWRDVLNGTDYVATLDGFSIIMKTKASFNIYYEVKRIEEEPCGTDPDTGEDILCEVEYFDPKTETDEISFDYTITVQKADDRKFEVFEPNAKLVLLHTPEWQKIHAKDEYKSSTIKSWYAGETILTHVILEPRHKHPVSGKYPVIQSTTSWMRELGGVANWMKRARVKERPYWHQVSLTLVQEGQTLWAGPKRDVPDPNRPGKYLFRNREKGVDNGVGRHDKKGPITMGDIWYGLQPGENYSVQGIVQFNFGVSKGFQLFDKNNGSGSQLQDYRSEIEIIDNALSRVLNFTQRK